MESIPFLINDDTTGQSLKPIGSIKGIKDETWLQGLLRQHPGILPVAQIESIFSPLVPIGREVTTETGAIDNLFISHRGYLVLVETKLWQNPEAKREVLAQAIDYGSSLSKWSYERLNNVVKDYTHRFENKEMSLVEWVEQSLGPVDDDHLFFEETVAKNLRLGRFLTLIVGDRIRDSLKDMLSYVNKYPHLAMDVALVELRCYRWNQGEEWPLLVVPSIVARTEIVERSVVQVNVQLDGSYQVDVEQVKKGEESHKKVSLTEEAYWELLKERNPESYDDVHDLIERYRQKLGVTIDTSEAAIVTRFNIQDSGQQATLFFVDKNGLLSVWPDTIGSQLAKAGLDNHLVDNYGKNIRTILHSQIKRQPAILINKVNLNEFNREVDNFIAQIEQASVTD